jgi:hypothetical protein
MMWHGQLARGIYDAGKKVGQAFQPDEPAPSGWKA